MIINDKLNIKYPLKLKPRDVQLDVFNFMKKSISRGKQYLLLDLPTGSGKSYLTIMFVNWYLNFVNKKAKFDILTNSKILQDQYIKDFSFIKNFKGKSNYYCDPHDMDCEKGFEICKTSGPKCGMSCPYQKARQQWISSTIGLTNFHLYNSLAIYVSDIIDERSPNVLIVDEAHDFESVFCDYISTSLSMVSLKKYGFSLSELENYNDILININNIEKYIGFIQNQFIEDITNKIEQLEVEIEKTASKKTKQNLTKNLTYCKSNREKFTYMLEEYDKKPENWVLDISKLKSDKMYSGVLLEVKPVWGNDYIKEIIFDRYDHIIFMSGSILDKNLFCDITGLNPKTTSYYNIDSQFKKKNRKIYYLKVGKMTYNEKSKTIKEQIKYIEKILKKYKEHKGIIHTSTYEFSQYLLENIKNNRLIFHDNENREEMLNLHLNSNKNSVIVSPSMTSGVDLKDDLSRFQIIIKIPYPYLGSNKVKQRQKTKPDWYSWKTVVDIIQAYGRSTRDFDDWSDTFILDASFSDILKYNERLFPRWVTDAITIIKI